MTFVDKWKYCTCVQEYQYNFLKVIQHQFTAKLQYLVQSTFYGTSTKTFTSTGLYCKKRKFITVHVAVFLSYNTVQLHGLYVRTVLIVRYWNNDKENYFFWFALQPKNWVLVTWLSSRTFLTCKKSNYPELQFYWYVYLQMLGRQSLITGSKLTFLLYFSYSQKVLLRGNQMYYNFFQKNEKKGRIFGWTDGVQ
jgi:hypothetical protein